MIDPVELTSRLVRFDTVNPPGRERECGEYLASMLEQVAMFNGGKLTSYWEVIQSSR